MILYDTPADVVAKALRGLGEMPSTVAGATGTPLHVIGDFLDGSFEPDIARQLAPALGLDPDALASFFETRPAFELPPGIRRLELPFEEETVNAWSLEMDGLLLVIDAGIGRHDLAQHLPPGESIDLLITHPHRDHIGGVEGVRTRIRECWSPTPSRGSSLVRPGDSRELAGRFIEVLGLAGHHPDAVGYLVEGYEVPVIAVGDAIFAQSIGGCQGPDAYKKARSNLLHALADAADETVLLTGHGAPTTVGIERTRNPFLAAWLNAAADGP